MSEDLKPCPFCGSEAGLSKGGRALCSNEGCIACDLFAPVEDWNRRAQPAEAEGVDFGINGRSVRVSQEAYSIFLDRERYLREDLASERTRADVAVADANDAERALSSVTAERDRFREQCRIHDMLHGTKGRERVAALLAQNEALRSFVTECAGTAGGMVNGNKLSNRAKELIAAMAAKEG